METRIVFRGSAVDAGAVESLLEEAGIKAFAEGELMGSIAPWQNAPGGAGAVRIIVRAEDENEARNVIDAYWNTRE